MAAATDREREIDMRMNDKLSIGTGRDREAAPDIRTEVRMDTIRAYLKKKLRSDGRMNCRSHRGEQEQT